MTQDWRTVFEEYRHISDRLPVKDDLVYVSHIGVCAVSNVYKNGDIDVFYNGKTMRFPTSHYRLIERKTLRPTFRGSY